MFFLQLPDVDVDKIIEADSVAKVNFADKVHHLMDMSPDDIIRAIITWGLELVWKIFVALVIYYAGRWIIRRIKRILTGVFKRRKVDSSLQTFLLNTVSISLTIILIIIIIDILGLDTTGFLALLASAGLAIGMALSGTLQNFAGGVMVLLLKPYRVGEYIETQGYEGTVKTIQLFNTHILTPENQTIIIPNGTISTSTIKNFVREPNRRAQWMIPIDYADDYEQTKEAIAAILESEPRVLKEPTYGIVLHTFGDSAIMVRVRAWAEYGDYWSVYYDLNARFFAELPAKGVNFPYNQLDVKIKNDKES